MITNSPRGTSCRTRNALVVECHTPARRKIIKTKKNKIEKATRSRAPREKNVSKKTFRRKNYESSKSQNAK